MNIIFYNLDFVKEFEIDDYLIFEIENQQLFQKCINNLYGYEVEVQDVAIVENNRVLEREKDYALIIDYYRHEYFSKSCLTRLYKNIEQHYSNDVEVSQKINSINKKVADFIKYLLTDYEGEFVFDNIVSIESILKFLTLKPQVIENLSIDNIINYITIVSFLSAYKLIVFINAQTFFSKNEIIEIIKVARYKGVKLLLLENKFYDNTITNKVQIDADYFVKNLFQ